MSPNSHASRSPPAPLQAATAGLLLLTISCAGVRTAPLDVHQEATESAEARVYRVDELQFEAPAGWASEVDARAFALLGGDGCRLSPGWGDPAALSGAGRVEQTGCPTLVVAPAVDFTPAECLDDAAFGRKNRWLASSGELTRSRETIDARLARRFDWRGPDAPPGRAVIWCVCGPSRPWYVTLWIPRDAEAEGVAALRRFQRTARLGLALLAP